MTRLVSMVLAVGALAVTGAIAMAQAGGGAPGGGFQMPPEMQAKMKAWQKFNANNKHVDQLSKTVRSLGSLESDPKTAFSKDQAKKLLGILKEWRNKPAMTDDQAGQVNKQINAILNINQIKALNSPGAMGRGMMGGRPGGGGPGGGGGRPGGPGGGMGNFKFPDPAPYNPLNPETNPFVKANPQMAQMIKSRGGEFMAKLEAKAK